MMTMPEGAERLVDRDTIMASEDRAEGIQAFFERREPQWPGR